MGSGKKPSIPEYATTTASNPYATAYVGESGNAYVLNDFLTAMNQGVEAYLPGLYTQLLNPTLDNATSQAKINAFTKELESSSYQQFENNVDALSQRGLLRSSAVNDMSNKLSQYQTSQIGDFTNNLMSNNTSETTQLINALLNQYTLGANLGSSALGNAFSSNQLTNNYNQGVATQQMNQYNAQLQTYSNMMSQIMKYISSNKS